MVTNPNFVPNFGFLPLELPSAGRSGAKLLTYDPCNDAYAMTMVGRNAEAASYTIKLVRVERLELPTSWSQTRRATRLRYTRIN